MRYEPALDGLRGVAVLLVVAFHSRVPGFASGFIGVDIFFVLSGYLIASLLIFEHRNAGKINLGAFYWRRALRLYPALIFFLAAYLVAAPFLWPDATPPVDALLAALYLTDYSMAFWNTPIYLTHTWSLSVEEHFYVLMPLALIATLRRCTPKQVVQVLAAATALALLWRTVHHGDDGAYFRFDTRLPGLLAGCTLAAIRAAYPALAVPSGKLVVAGGLLLAVALTSPWDQRLVFAIPVAEAATVCLLLGKDALPLTQPKLVALGKLSYAVYLWHAPIARVLRENTDWWVTAAWTLAIAVSLAWLSFNTVEAFARRYRETGWGQRGVVSEPVR